MSSQVRIDSSLIARIKKGEEAAFDELFTKLHHQVFLYSLKFVHSREAAEEIMQDVFVTLWKKREKLDLQFSVDALMFKITKDLCINYLRKQSRENSLKAELQYRSAGEVSYHTENQIIYNDYYALAIYAIDQLPTQRKRIFEMKQWIGMRDEEIAHHLGISKNTVKVQLARAGRFIRKYIIAHTDASQLFLLSLLSLL